MNAHEWWKWFWRFALAVELAGAGVGFLAMAIFAQPSPVAPGDAAAALGSLSVAVVESTAALVTFAASLWGLGVTVPVWLFSECFFWWTRDALESRNQEEFVAKLLAQEAEALGDLRNRPAELPRLKQ